MIGYYLSLVLLLCILIKINETVLNTEKIYKVINYITVLLKVKKFKYSKCFLLELIIYAMNYLVINLEAICPTMQNQRFPLHYRDLWFYSMAVKQNDVL